MKILFLIFILLKWASIIHIWPCISLAYNWRTRISRCKSWWCFSLLFVELLKQNVHSAAKLTVKEICSLCNDFYCYLNDSSELNLKENHAYCYQVQGTMVITKPDFCNFTIWILSLWKLYGSTLIHMLGKWIYQCSKTMQYMLPCILN